MGFRRFGTLLALTANLVILLNLFDRHTQPADACGFGTINCCGGGGCGSGCGRKKRSIVEAPPKTEATDLCPQLEWRDVISENLGSDVSATEYAIQDAMVREFDRAAKIFVTCTPQPRNHSATATASANSAVPPPASGPIMPPPASLKFVSNGDAYCSYGDALMWCTVAALLA